MEQYNGEPGALRGACPVLREDCANLPPKGGKAALSYSTLLSAVLCIIARIVATLNMFLSTVTVGFALLVETNTAWNAPLL